MNIRDLNERRTPIVKIDESLDKLHDKSLFKDKVEEANRILREVGLPKGLNPKDEKSSK